MPVDIKKLLRTALSEIEREEEHDRLESRFKALEERKPEMRLGDLVSALENASDAELNALESTVLRDLVREARVEDETKDDDKDDEDGGDGLATPPPKKKTRPGRKSGMAYDWWVDEDTGGVVKLPVARVYTGEDEPDEVDLPAVKETE